MSDEFLERIADALERIGDQLDVIQDQLEQLGGHRPAVLPNPKPLLAASTQEMLVAVGDAVQETRATSLDHAGMVIKAARGKLKERRFNEIELQTTVRQVLTERIEKQ